MVAIQVVPAKIIGHVQIGPAVIVRISPRAGKTVAIIVNVQAGSVGNIFEPPASGISKQKIRGPVARVEVRRWIAVLVESGVVVEAEIDVQAAIAVVVSDGG